MVKIRGTLFQVACGSKRVAWTRALWPRDRARTLPTQPLTATPCTRPPSPRMVQRRTRNCTSSTRTTRTSWLRPPRRCSRTTPSTSSRPFLAQRTRKVAIRCDSMMVRPPHSSRGITSTLTICSCGWKTRMVLFSTVTPASTLRSSSGSQRVATSVLQRFLRRTFLPRISRETGFTTSTTRSCRIARCRSRRTTTQSTSRLPRAPR